MIIEKWFRPRWKRISVFYIVKLKKNQNFRNFGGLGPKTEFGDFGPKTSENTFFVMSRLKIML